MIRLYKLNVRNRPAAIALAVAALAIGAVFVALGIILLLGLAAIGTVIGAGFVLYRSLIRRNSRQLRAPHPDAELDPSLEVSPRTQPRDGLTS